MAACVQGAGRKGDSAEHKESRAPSPAGEALRLQPLPQGVPGPCQRYLIVIFFSCGDRSTHPGSVDLSVGERRSPEVHKNETYFIQLKYTLV